MMRTMAVSKRLLVLSVATTLGALAVAGFTHAPSPATQADAAPVITTVNENDRVNRFMATYYTRLGQGKIGDPQVLWSLFTPEFRVHDEKDPGFQGMYVNRGEGC